MSYSIFAILSLIVATTQAGQLINRDLTDSTRNLCTRPQENLKEITSVSHMLQVIGYFDKTIPVDDECRAKWIDSMRALRNVLTNGNEDACGDEKLTLIEDFNHQYVSTSSKDKYTQKKENLKAPKVLRVFFAHYAYAISNQCKERLISSLKESNKSIDDQNEKLLSMLNGFLKMFALNPAKNGYKDLVMPWNLLDNYHIPGVGKRLLPKALDMSRASATKMPVRLSIRMREAERVKETQLTCLSQLKPSYSKHVLPVMRLINIGLYEDDEPLAKLLPGNHNLQRLFEVALYCESLLPVEVFQDASLEKEKIVAVTPEKATLLRAEQPTLQSSGFEQPAAPAESLQADEIDEIGTLADAVAAKRLTKALKSNRIKQESVVKRLIKMSREIIKTKIGVAASQFYKSVNPNGQNLETELVPREHATGVTRHRRVVAICLMVFVVILIIIFVILYTVHDSRPSKIVA